MPNRVQNRKLNAKEIADGIALWRLGLSGKEFYLLANDSLSEVIVKLPLEVKVPQRCIRVISPGVFLIVTYQGRNPV